MDLVALENDKMLRRKRKSSSDKEQMFLFFKELWKKRRHNCENCGKWLGNEPLSYMFDHVLEKSKYPQLILEEDNIMFLCLECHDSKTRGFITEKIRAKIEELKKKFYI